MRVHEAVESPGDEAPVESARRQRTRERLVDAAYEVFAEFGVHHDLLGATPILAPGLGHQGARFSDLCAIYGPATANVVVSASRSLLAAGPDELAAAIAAQAAEVAQAVNA